MQLLALKRGDVDVAFNLLPEQVATVKDDPNISIVRITSLDFLYLAIEEDPDNPIMQNAKARQAVGYAIDYDGIINHLAGGNAVRPAAFLPVGVNGSTEELTKEIGGTRPSTAPNALMAEAGVAERFHPSS